MMKERQNDHKNDEEYTQNDWEDNNVDNEDE